jgi:hypothetical protein
MFLIVSIALNKLFIKEPVADRFRHQAHASRLTPLDAGEVNRRGNSAVAHGPQTTAFPSPASHLP